MSSKQPPLGSAALQAPSQTTQVVHVSPSTCHDLSLFKEILKEYRRIDDTIVMRLNRANAVMRDKQRTQDLSVPSIQEQACLQMWRELVANWSQRTKLVDYCVMVVDKSVNEKKQAMQEQSNDPITRRRTQAAIYEDEVKVDGRKCTTSCEWKASFGNEQSKHSGRDVNIFHRQHQKQKGARFGRRHRSSQLITIKDVIAKQTLHCVFLLNMHAIPLLLSLPLAVALYLPSSILQLPFRWLLDGTASDDIKVPVTLGVMSRCPDAMLCENVFNQVLEKVGDKIQLSLTYVAKINSSDGEFGVTCMHGAQECAGNVQQLCVAKHENRKNWWEFVQCQNYDGREAVGRPELALKCAHTAGIDWENGGSGRCAGIDGSGKGKEGIHLLHENVKATKKLGITKSCTVMINNREVCVHDGMWQRCEKGHTVNDFVDQINQEYEQLNSD